jgi:hypothetical protein
MEARARDAGHWRRWNGAEWNRLELAKSGPSPADVSLEASSGDSSAAGGLVMIAAGKGVQMALAGPMGL